jgi:hypothetical protein
MKRVRRILIPALIVILTILILWVITGRQISEFVDQFKTQEIKSEPVHSISYQGTGEGGEFEIHFSPGRLKLSLAPLSPHIGTDKENQLALANTGRVFALGPMHSGDNDTLAAELPGDDIAFIKFDHGFLPWLDVATSTVDHRLVLRRHWYWQLIWAKPNGAKMNMLWRSKAPYDETLWRDMVIDDSSLLPANETTALIRIEISDASR